MRTVLLAGASMTVLATTPAAAQGRAGDAEILQRLQALEAKVGALEAQNADLRRQLSGRSAAAPQPAPASGGAQQTARMGGPGEALPAGATSGGAPAPQETARASTKWTIVPEFQSPDGNFSLKPRGILDIDGSVFNERAGGYDWNNGTQFRRGRFGFDGTLYKDFAWRIEAEFVGGDVALLDAFVAYAPNDQLTVTLGQLKVPAGLEANSSDAFNTFMERGMGQDTFGAVAQDRRVGATVAYAGKLVTATAGFYGANESIGRSSDSPDEVYGMNGRVTLEPINEKGRLLHVGASAYKVMGLRGKDFTLGDRPEVRIDNGNLLSIPFTGDAGASSFGATPKSETFYDVEAAAVYGPFGLQGEYNHAHFDRTGTLADPDFHSFYVFGSLFLTGESRPFRDGVIDRLKPRHNFDPASGHWGAFEIALRYDRLDLTDYDFSPLRKVSHGWTGALNWYLNGNLKMLFNYLHFTATNSNLVATPVSIYGTTAKGDAFAARVHLDF